MNIICPLAHRSEQASYKRLVFGSTPKWAIFIFSCSLSGKTTVSGTVVLGSSPDGRTLCSDSSIGRVPALQAGCCGFKSRSLLKMWK